MAAVKKKALPVVEQPKLLFKQPSGSNAEAFVRCGASHVLPQSDRGGEYRDRGTEGHEALAAIVNGRMPSTTLHGIESVRHFKLEEVLAGVEARKGETAYAVSVKTKTARYLGQDLGRNYGPLERFEIPCTIDVEGQKGERAYVRDWKFGTYASWFQLLVQSMALVYPDKPEEGPLAYEVDAGFVLIDGGNGGKSYFEEEKVLSLEEIDVACDALHAAWLRVEEMADLFHRKGIVPPQAIGDWCKYCGAFPRCPAQQSLVAAMIGKLVTLEENLGEFEEEDLAQAWERVRMAKASIERIEEAIKGAALRKPIPLSNGKMLTMVEASGRVSVDKNLALQTIRRLGGTDKDCDAVLKRGRPYLMVKEIRS